MAQPTPLVQRFAVVIGSNEAGGQPLDELNYADDDALNNCELLAELGAAVTVFTSKDDQTRKRRAEAHPTAPHCAKPERPFTHLVENHLKNLVNEVRAAPAGTRSVIVLWFSGHGSGDALFLQNGPLTTTRLRELLLDPTQGYADVHLILDSCNAQKFVTGRDGKGRKLDPKLRNQVNAIPKGLNLTVNSHVGALIAATEFNKVHEYSPLEAGILSYELRAALRNGADANGDHRVTYREAEAFVWAANSGVESIDARMYGRAFLPGGEDDVLADWNDPQAQASRSVALSLSASEEVRFRVRDPRRVLVFETHKGRESDANRTTTVFLPAGKSYEIDLLGKEGNWLDRRRLDAPSPGTVAFATLPRGDIADRARGEIEQSLDKGLFQRPYDARLFADYRNFREGSPDAAWLASRDSPEDAPMAAGPSAWPFVFGGVGVAAIGTGVVYNLLARAENKKVEDACGSTPATECTVTSAAERQDLQDHVDTAKRQRTISYVSFGVGGAALLGGTVIFLTERSGPAPRSTWVSPSVGPRSASLLVGGRF